MYCDFTKNYQQGAISLSKDSPLHLKPVNVTFKLPEHLDEYDAVFYINDIDDNKKNIVAGYLKVKRGVKEVGKFPPGKYYLETQKGYRAVTLEEGSVIEISDAD